MEIDHEKILTMVRTELPTDELLIDLADLYKIFSDTTRVKILFALSKSELCVYAISELLNMNQSAISHQLKTLRNANLIKSRRFGKMICYSLADAHVEKILSQGFDHLIEERGKENEKNL